MPTKKYGDGCMNLTNYDILFVIIISFLTSIIVLLGYILIRKHKRIYINFANINSLFYGKGKNGYLEKEKKLTEKTTYVEISYILSISNSDNRPYTFRNLLFVSKKKRKSKLEEGSLNLNGTSKSVAGVTSYEKLKHLVIKPYECIDYDVNIRLSKDEYNKYKSVYLSYVGSKNKVKYIKLNVKRK